MNAQPLRRADVVHLHNEPRSAVTVLSPARDAVLARRVELSAALEQLADIGPAIDRAMSLLIEALRSGHKVLVAGNGGSAAEGQHFATELVGRFKRERRGYPVIALTADTAILTAVANDYGYERVFARQIEALGQPGDVFVAFSTSGTSPNIVCAGHQATEIGMATIAVTGSRPCRLANCAHVAIAVPAVDTPLVQELHTVVLHILCDGIEAALADGVQA